MHPAASMMLAGILPFGAVFIELFFILNVRAVGWHTAA
jgi:transmembrane 9 superfamily protein 2/4